MPKRSTITYYETDYRGVARMVRTEATTMAAIDTPTDPAMDDETIRRLRLTGDLTTRPDLRRMLTIEDLDPTAPEWSVRYPWRPADVHGTPHEAGHFWRDASGRVEGWEPGLWCGRCGWRPA